MKYTELTCEGCSSSYSKPSAEYRRNRRLGRRNFCSRSCAGKNLVSEVKVPTDKTCRRCKVDFKAGSRFIYCGNCRGNEKKGKCVDCSKAVWKVKGRCKKCSDKIRKGVITSDELSPFREYVRRTRRRGKDTDVTVDSLKEVWESQGGKCVYSGVQLVHVKYNVKSNTAFTASLDRIDSDKGYVNGNVQFISIAMNYMKSTMSHEEVVNLINIIRSCSTMDSIRVS